MSIWNRESSKEATSQGNSPMQERWERQVLQDIALEGIKERRRARRWGIFFKLAFLAYLLLLVVLVRDWDFGLGGDPAPSAHTAVVRVDGAIAPGGDNSAQNIIRGLQNAFDHESTRAVVLHINSPGGSPVQSAQINDEVQRLKAMHPDIPVYAVADDMFTSGAYYLAVSADEIYVSPATLIGSIGVLFNGFGAEEAIQRLGIERRLYTAGENKAFLDPFSSADPDDVAWLQDLLDDIHQQFISAVRDGRGDRLNGDDSLFSGLVWNGEQGVELGLADGLGNLNYVAREVVGVDELRDFTPRRSFLDQFGSRLGSSVTNAALDALGGRQGLQ